MKRSNHLMVRKITNGHADLNAKIVAKAAELTLTGTPRGNSVKQIGAIKLLANAAVDSRATLPSINLSVEEFILIADSWDAAKQYGGM